MTVKAALETFSAIQAKIDALDHAGGILYYDGSTVAPPASTEHRGETLGYLSELGYNLATSKETCDTVDYLLAHEDELTAEQKRNVKLFNKDREYMQSIPLEKYTAFQMLQNKASAVWHEAKQKNDYAMFAPYLQQLIDTSIEFAHYYKPDKYHYDVMLDSKETGLDVKQCDEFFDTVKSGIVPLIKKVLAKKTIDDSFLFGSFPTADQRKITDAIIDFEKLDPQRSVCGETEHPFTTNFSTEDVRITTHYYEDGFVSSMYSVAHEGGHALYELGINPAYNKTSLSGGVSMGIHECQSRFFENIICRSKAFCDFILPKLKEIFPEQLKGVTTDMYYRAINKAAPSLIRTEADELTYPLHILIRYEIEKAIMAGEVTVDELPALWNAKYKEYLGVDVPDDTRGILQDMHWSEAMFGYFPSYALGSAYGAQILSVMKKTIDVNGDIAKGDVSNISAWLHDRIWQYGSLYDPKELFENAVGAPFDPHYFIDYLTEKYTEIYNL